MAHGHGPVTASAVADKTSGAVDGDGAVLSMAGVGAGIGAAVASLYL